MYDMVYSELTKSKHQLFTSVDPFFFFFAQGPFLELLTTELGTFCVDNCNILFQKD